MSLLDGYDLFGSGPHTIRPEGWGRAIARRAFAGVDGELILDLGLRSRCIVQDGRLQAGSSSALHTLISQIEAVIDGRMHTLLDNYGRTYAPLIVEHFAPTTAVKRGRGFWCDYTIQYRQLP